MFCHTLAINSSASKSDVSSTISLSESSSSSTLSNISDHLPIFSIVFEERPTNHSAENNTYTFRDNKLCNYVKFLEKLKDLNWSQITSLSNPSEAYSKFIFSFTSIYEKRRQRKLTR